MAVAVNEIRRPDGTVLAMWPGEVAFDWGGISYPDEWEVWRDGEKLSHYWRTENGWAWEVF